MAGWRRIIADVARVAPVYTLPIARRGHATALVASLSPTLLEQGRGASSSSPMCNPVSNSIYAKIGYRPRPIFHFEFVGATARVRGAA
jgi:predicted GNAT family acetyltransferase